MRRLLMLLLLTPLPALAQLPLRVDALAYYVPVTYGDASVTSAAHVGGVYVYAGYGRFHAVEAAADVAHVTYRGGTVVDQREGTLRYSLFIPGGVRAVLGGRYTASNEPFTTGAYTFMAGAEYARPYIWSAGLDVFHTRYPNFGAGHSVNQATMRAAYLWGDVLTPRTVGAELAVHAIAVPEGLTTRGGRVMLSAEPAVTLTYGRASATISAWAGEQAFAARNRGFVVYNRPEVYLYGAAASVRYALGPRLAATVGGAWQRFRNRGDDALTHGLSGQLSIGYTLLP